jgi:prolyl oligopeptidase
MRAKYVTSEAWGLLLVTAYVVGVQAQTAPPPPPTAPVKPVIDNYHGTKVSDPYRYMENLEDPAVQSWFKAQDNYTRSMLANIPGREHLLTRITELDQSVTKVGASRLSTGSYLVNKQLPGEDVFKLYLRKQLTGQDRLLLDPTKISLAASSQAKGKNTIWGYSSSDDAKYLAIGIIPGGSELDGEIHVIETETGRETGDVIPRECAEAWEPHWLPDNKSFVYGKLQTLPTGAPAAEVRQKFSSYLHVLGTDPAKDEPVFGFGIIPSIDVDPSLIASVDIQPGARYALGLLNGSVTPNSAYYIAPVDDIGKSKEHWHKFADLADGVTSVAVHGDDLYVLTYKNAPRSKIVRTDARHPDLTTAVTVVPPSEAVIQGIYPAQDALYVQLLDGGIGRALRVGYEADAHVERIALPFEGAVWVRGEPQLPGVRLYMSSWTKAFAIYAYDPATHQVTDTKLQPAGPYDSPANIDTIEVKVKSHDGVSVPLSIVYPRGIKLDGSHPTLLYGYAAYGVAEPPGFDPTEIAWYEKGGINAVCHARGGGEYGEEWHQAGKGPSKPNTWRDFISCAQYLIDHKYTSPAHLAGEGISGGGILIGRAITERPDLFGAAIDKVGMSDTLRSETTQNGETNIPEFGTTKTEDGFKELYAMSSYEHVEQGTRYPAVLLETGMNDPRIAPWEMAKMTARLQAASSSQKPVLLRVDFAGGHGAMAATEKQNQESLADEWSFLLWQLGALEFQPGK